MSSSLGPASGALGLGERAWALVAPDPAFLWKPEPECLLLGTRSPKGMGVSLPVLSLEPPSPFARERDGAARERERVKLRGPAAKRWGGCNERKRTGRARTKRGEGDGGGESRAWERCGSTYLIRPGGLHIDSIVAPDSANIPSSSSLR